MECHLTEMECHPTEMKCHPTEMEAYTDTQFNKVNLFSLDLLEELMDAELP
uniref:Uncharacterized protein n=1 Tax=Arion vulgaris TaxID=1028688 RepID=A0A0B7AMV9_9EUPU